MNEFINSIKLDKHIEHIYKCKILYKSIDTFVYQYSEEIDINWKHLYSGSLLFTRDGMGLKLILLPRNITGIYTFSSNNFYYKIINNVIFLKQNNEYFSIYLKYSEINKEIINLLKSCKEL